MHVIVAELKGRMLYNIAHMTCLKLGGARRKGETRVEGVVKRRENDKIRKNDVDGSSVDCLYA